MEEKIRKLIRENISKLFEGYEDDYISSFEIEDIPEMMPGGEAHKAFIKDLESEPSMGKYKEITNDEFKNLVKGMQQANLDLSDDKNLVYQAEKKIDRQLNSNEVDKLLKVKKQMEKIMGFGSYN